MIVAKKSLSAVANVSVCKMGKNYLSRPSYTAYEWLNTIQISLLVTLFNRSFTILVNAQIRLTHDSCLGPFVRPSVASVRWVKTVTATNVIHMLLFDSTINSFSFGECKFVQHGSPRISLNVGMNGGCGCSPKTGDSIIMNINTTYVKYYWEVEMYTF
jgi:hypothetical protein